LPTISATELTIIVKAMTKRIPKTIRALENFENLDVFDSIPASFLSVPGFFVQAADFPLTWGSISAIHP